MSDLAYLRFVQGRLSGMRNSRYSWWAHWCELANYFLPRRYKWLVTPNQWNRGSPLNQNIIDSTGVICARNLASGMMSGKTSPSRPWFKLRIGRIDATQTNAISLWLAECERLMKLVFHESNFYNAIATFYYDLVIFGTAVVIIYEDFDNVINCYNPAAGEYFIDLNGRYRPVIFYRDFVMTIGAVVNEFGLENCSESVQSLYKEPSGSGVTKEIIVGHAVEPNDDDRSFGIPSRFKYREVYWEVGGASSNVQMKDPTKFLRKKGYNEQCAIACRWDTVSNDPYGRSPAMDALGDQKQLQQQSRRKAQAIDKMVNPPLVADTQLQNKPASLLPGGMTYVHGFTSSGKPGIASVYDTKFPIGEMTEDMNEVRGRLLKTFFNDLFQPLSQYETRSNITIAEIDQRKAESLIMLGPVFERVDDEALGPIIERVWGIMVRAGIIPPPPPEVSEFAMDIEFVSMLQSAQSASEAASIERMLSLAGNLVGAAPEVLDKVNTDRALDKYSLLLQNDPSIMRSDDEVAMIRQQRAKQQQAAMQAEIAEKMAAGAKNLAAADTSQPNLLTSLMGGGGGI